MVNIQRAAEAPSIHLISAHYRDRENINKVTGEIHTNSERPQIWSNELLQANGHKHYGRNEVENTKMSWILITSNNWSS